jgi:hypothetical protein
MEEMPMLELSVRPPLFRNDAAIPLARAPRDGGGDDAFHRRLSAFNAERFSPRTGEDDRWEQDIAAEAEIRRLEISFIERERNAIAARAARAPSDADSFLDWFKALEHAGPGQGDALFPYLADHATREEMRWFLAQEVAGEAGFEDLVALTQVKFPTQAKLEFARNYWDEMGRGNAAGMHGPMLQLLASALELSPQIESTVSEALALNNMMVGLAANRRYAYHSTGALGSIELTAPGRAAQVSAGLRRLGVSGKARHYFDLHAVLDRRHFEAWSLEIFHSLVAESPQLAQPLAEGALLRLRCGERCFERYRRAFGLAG